MHRQRLAIHRRSNRRRGSISRSVRRPSRATDPVTRGVPALPVGMIGGRTALALLPFSQSLFQVRTLRIESSMIGMTRGLYAAAGDRSRLRRQRLSRPRLQCACTCEDALQRNTPRSLPPLRNPIAADRPLTRASTASSNDVAEPASALSTARPGNVATSGLLPNLAGPWMLRTEVESSSYTLRRSTARIPDSTRPEGRCVTGSGKKSPRTVATLIRPDKRRCRSAAPSPVIV